MTFKKHKERWCNCQRCPLHKTRKHVVLLRGTVPAPVLFVGEAPGQSEDVLGRPFVGPAGKLLDRIIGEAGLNPGDFALTNLIGCIPLDEDNAKVSAPPEDAVTACKPRLIEVFDLVRPKLVVWVGREAESWGPYLLKYRVENIENHAMIHPAAILRMHVTMIGLTIQKEIVALADVWDALIQTRKVL